MHNLALRKLATGLALVIGLLQPQGAWAEFNLETAQRAAANGDVKAEYFLGKQYEKGRGVPQDHARAVEHYRRAAEAGYAPAQNDLGALYAKGLGVKQDWEVAARWYRRAAEQGDSLAQYSMARIYLQGRGVAKDVQESLRWLKNAAAQNEPNALEMLGDLYLKARERVMVDEKLAFEYFQRAVEHGCIRCLNSLGFLYEQGINGRKDPKRAVQCYRDAAEKGDARGQMNLGRMYHDGIGVETDLVEACKWFTLAQRNGEGIANHYLEELEDVSHLTSRDKEEAERRADRFQEEFSKSVSSQPASTHSTGSSAVPAADSNSK